MFSFTRSNPVDAGFIISCVKPVRLNRKKEKIRAGFMVVVLSVR